MRAARRVREGARGKRPVATPAPRPRAYLTTALREAKAPLRGAGPGTGPMLRSGSPDLVRQETRGLGRRHRDDPRRRPRRRARRRSREEGPPRRARRSGPATCPSPAPSGRSCPRSASGHACYQAVTSEIAGYRNVVDRDRHRARKSKSPSAFAHASREGHRHPHRPRRHHHGQHPSLTSGNTVNPRAEPRRTVDPAAPARHAALRHARRKGTTRSNQKQELPTTGQTSKAHGLVRKTGWMI